MFPATGQCDRPPKWRIRCIPSRDRKRPRAKSSCRNVVIDCAMATPKDPRAPDPWANFPGGNPFGPGGPFAGGNNPFAGAGDPFQNLDAWLRQMGVDPADFRRMADEMQRNLQEALKGMGADPSKSLDRKSTRLNSSHSQISYA